MRRYNRELKRSVHLFVPDLLKMILKFCFWKILKNVPYGGRYSRQDGNFRLQKAFEESVIKGSVVHGGDYNYHNLIMPRDDIAVTDFEHMHTDIQIKDFCYFKKSNGKKSMETKNRTKNIGSI